MTLNNPWHLTRHPLRSHVQLYAQRSLCLTPMEIHQRVRIQRPFSYLKKNKETKQNIKLKGQLPLDDLWPHLCWSHRCDTTQVSLCPSPMQIHQSMWIQWPRNFKQKVIDPKEPQDDLMIPHFCRAHVWLLPRIIVFNSHIYIAPINIHKSMWIWQPLFQKTLTKVNDLWKTLTLLLLRSHLWLFPCIIVPWSQYMYIQWSILKKKKDIYLHTRQNEWSNSRTKVRARQKWKSRFLLHDPIIKFVD